jgi:cytochrome P450
VPSVNQLDGVDHTRLRKALHPFFAKHRVAALEGEVRALARECLAAARGGVLDAARELAEPVAAHVACRLLDLPREDAPRFQRWVARYMANAPGDLGRSPDALAAALEMNAWLAERVRERRAGAARDGARVVDRLLEARVGGRALSDLEIASHLQTLVIGGTETTPKVVAAALLRLHQSPSQRAAVQEGRARASDAFEEALRLDSPTQFMARTLARDRELDGKRMRAGQGVLLLYASANRDEREFPEPERFDVLRRPKRMLGFGHGAHLCLGLHVARLEARIVLEEVLARAPRYAVDEAGVVRVASDQMRGIASLPLQLG